MTGLPRIDHIIIGAKDLKAAADDIYNRYGLASYLGGRHQGWGTENVIVPLGGAGYLEIAAVFDEQLASQIDWGKLVLGTPVTPTKPWALLTFCVETAEGASQTAARLGAETAPMLRLLPSGARLTWRVAAMSRFDAPGRTPAPFFISWDDPAQRPDQKPAAHKCEPRGIEYVELSGDEAAMDAWIASPGLPLRWVPGPPGLRAVGICTAEGIVRLE